MVSLENKRLVVLLLESEPSSKLQRKQNRAAESSKSFGSLLLLDIIKPIFFIQHFAEMVAYILNTEIH